MDDIQAIVLQSGSSGNCMILNGILALDMGIAYSKLYPYIKNLQLVWVGHGHGDHLKKSTIQRLALERPSLRFAGGSFLASDFIDSGVPSRRIDILDPNTRYDYGLFQIEPVPLHHDIENHGLKIFMGGKKAIYITDTGYVDDINAVGFDYFYVEANHTRSEIEARVAEKHVSGKFAYEYRAAQNHLSYERAMDWLAQNAGPNSRYVLLHQHKEVIHETD